LGWIITSIHRSLKSSSVRSLFCWIILIVAVHLSGKVDWSTGFGWAMTSRDPRMPSNLPDRLLNPSPTVTWCTLHRSFPVDTVLLLDALLLECLQGSFALAASSFWYSVTILAPYPNFPLFSTILFRALGHSSLTRSLTRRSDRHQVT